MQIGKPRLQLVKERTVFLPIAKLQRQSHPGSGSGFLSAGIAPPPALSVPGCSSGHPRAQRSSDPPIPPPPWGCSWPMVPDPKAQGCREGRALGGLGEWREVAGGYPCPDMGGGGFWVRLPQAGAAGHTFSHRYT